MAGQKTPRPAKRHLVRWTDDMDKKLLLTIQSVCNADGVKIPWDKVGAIMGDQITDGAVIQHLAKLRQRMVAQGLSVPPPLRRGGGSLISTGYSGSSYSTSKPATARNTKATTNIASSDVTQDVKEGDEEDFDVDKASDSNGEFTETPSKRVKREPKGKKSRVKKDDSDSNDEHIPKAEKANGKRKHSEPGATKTTANANLEVEDAESVAASRTLHGHSIVSAVGRERRSSVDYADIDDNDDFDDEYPSDNQFVAAGASFLEMQGAGNGPEVEYQGGKDPENFESGNIGEQSENPRKLVVLRIGNGESAVRKLQNESNNAVEHTTNYLAPAMPRAVGTTDYITPYMPRGIGLSGHAIDRVAEQQLHWPASLQDRGHDSNTPSRRSSTGYSARSPRISGNNAVELSRYGSVGHMSGYYPASDFTGHSMVNQPLQQNPGHGLPGSTSLQYAQMEAPRIMPSQYTQQASAPHSYPNPSSVAAANWGASASLARNMAYNDFETGYGANDMFSQGMLEDPILAPEDSLEEFDFS